MAMDSETLLMLAERVDRAALLCRAIPKLTLDYPALTFEEAYLIQRRSMHRRIARGDALVGMKMGLTSVAKMEQMGVREPIYGHLTQDMARTSGDTLSMSAQIHPRVEPELAFILGRPLEGPVTAAQALASVEAVCAAIEVIDSRYERFEFTLADVIADNASSTRFFLGDVLRRPDELDLGNVGMVMTIDGEVKQLGTSAAIYEHPARSLAALANMLHTLGESLPAGAIVLAGAATAAEFVKAGQHVSLRADGFGEVRVEVIA